MDKNDGEEVEIGKLVVLETVWWFIGFETSKLDGELGGKERWRPGCEKEGPAPSGPRRAVAAISWRWAMMSPISHIGWAE